MTKLGFNRKQICLEWPQNLEWLEIFFTFITFLTRKCQDYLKLNIGREYFFWPTLSPKMLWRGRVLSLSSQLCSLCPIQGATRISLKKIADTQRLYLTMTQGIWPHNDQGQSVSQIRLSQVKHNFGNFAFTNCLHYTRAIFFYQGPRLRSYQPGTLIR